MVLLIGSAFKSFRQAKKYKNKERNNSSTFTLSVGISFFATRQLCVILKFTAPDKSLGGAELTCAVCYAATSLWDTPSGPIQHGQTEPNTGKRWLKGIILHGFTFRPAHCVNQDIVLVDLVLVMLEFLLQVQQLVVGKLSGAFCLLDR